MAGRPITIVGGGLAGLALGIALRQRSVPVTLWEAGHYPRHRVCGEFISGAGTALLEQLGVRDTLRQAGVVEAQRAVFFAANGGGIARDLPTAALCISRYHLDHLLATKFRALGGELLEQRRWTDSNFAEGTVRATGRRVTTQGRWHFVGLKVHVRGLPLDADLEVHFQSNGYIGLCRLPNNVVNVCGLFWTQGKERPAKQWRNVLLGASGSPLHQRLVSAEIDESSFCAIAGVSLRPRRAKASMECSIGDAVTMIPPLTGNGMSMALESAQCAVEPLTGYSRGAMNWEEARALINQACDARFYRRLEWAYWLQCVLMNRVGRAVMTRAFANLRSIWPLFFSKTR